MARIEYGVLLLAVAALSFQFGATLSAAPPPPAPDSPTVVDVHRLAAVERRIDELCSRMAAVPASMAPQQREVAESAAPTLSGTLAELREAAWSMARSHPQASVTATVPPPTNLAAVQAMLTRMQANGVIENSDLMMLTLPQVLTRLGCPSRVECGQGSYMTLVFSAPGADLNLGLQNDRVISIFGCKRQ